jgi:hypothetical protein
MSPSLPPFLDRRAVPAAPLQADWQAWRLRRRWLPARAAADLRAAGLAPRPFALALSLMAGCWFCAGFLTALAALQLAQPRPTPVAPAPSTTTPILRS